MKSIRLKIVSAIIAYCLVVASVGIAKPAPRKKIVVPTVDAARWPWNSSPDLDPLLKNHKVINSSKLEVFSNEYWTWIWLRGEIAAFNQDFRSTALSLPPEYAATVSDHYRLLELNDRSTYIFWFNYSIRTTLTFAIILATDGRIHEHADVHVCRIEDDSRKECWSGDIDVDDMQLRRGVLYMGELQWPPFW